MKVPIPAGRLGAGDTCPLCGATSGVTPSADGYACVLCGGPRVVVDGAIARSGREKPHLERARALQKRRAGWGLLASGGAAASAVALAVSFVLALVMHLGDTGGEVASALVLAPLLFSVFGFSRVRSASREVRAALADAELAVATDLAAAKGGALEGPELARLLHVSPARGEELSASLQVETFLSAGDAPPAVRVRVGEDLASEVDAEAESIARKTRSE